MKKLLIISIMGLLISTTLCAQQKGELQKARAEIARMIEERKSEKDGYVVSELLALKIDNASSERSSVKRNLRTSKIYYSGPSTLRFYVYAEAGTFQLKLRQNGEGILNKIEEPVFLEKTLGPKDSEYSMYEYFFEEDNDFVIDLKSMGEPEGCAMVVVTAESSKKAFRLKGFEISDEPVQ